MRTPLAIQELDQAVFEAYNTINWMTVGVLTLSAKYRVLLCLERAGNFIGDAIDECCRRAKTELETETDIIFLSVRDEFHDGPLEDDPDEADNGRYGTDEPESPLPSFRRWLSQPSLDPEGERD